jgi:large subunit ribosomal protein L9
MEVILLERIAKLGQMGDVVRVKDGFARNFLLPRGKALRATKENTQRFETMRVELEARNLELKSEAEKVAAKLDGQHFVVIRQASEAGQLYGSVSTRDLVGLLAEGRFTVARDQIVLNAPIKSIGRHNVPISLHPEIETAVTVVVARNADEAARIERGEDLTVLREEGAAPETEDVKAATTAAEAFFEPEVAARQSSEEPEAEPATGDDTAGRS